MQITYFGTGVAINPYVDTMHMLLEDNLNQLYIDAGGGMSLMQKVLRKDIKKPEYIRITHCHSDHLLGIVHLLRIHKTGKLTIFCTQTIQKNIEQLMHIVGKHKLYQQQIDEKLIEYRYINKEKEIALFDWTITPLNLLSTKAEQYGFILKQGDKKITFLGDEAIDVLKKLDYKDMIKSNWLLCEAFCLDSEKNEKQPHEKSHITAKESGEIANTLQAKNLILSHISNHVIDRKKQLSEIKHEAGLYFDGNIEVPRDNQIIQLR